MIPPKDIGSAVAEGFTLPWNTTRSLADVAADELKRKLSEAGRRGAEARAAKSRKQFVEDYHKRKKLTKGGKIAFAGYDGTEAGV